MKNTLIRLYAGIVSLLFGIVFSAQILSFTGLYRAWIAIPITLIVIVLAYIAYMRSGKTWFEALSPQESPSHLLSNTILLTCIIIVLTVFLQRLVLWHVSTAGQAVSIDFANYHSIKVFQLLRDGSNWNLAIPYGQYPSAYESLIAFGMFFTGDIRITGTVHALIVLSFWLTMALLIVRYSKLSIDVSLLLALAICFMPIIFPQAMNVGKNDMLLSLTVLMAICHAPVGDERFHAIGLAFATMLSLATKATGLYILFYLWGLVMLNWYRHFRKNSWQDYLHPAMFLLVIALMFPGGLWVIRNYLVLGNLFTWEITTFFQTSIFANLDNPVLYNSPRSYFIYNAAGLIIVAIIAALFHKRLRWQMAGTVLVIALTFVVTPLSAFLTINNLDYLDVQWRFVMHGIVILWVIAIVLASPLIRWMYARVVSQKHLCYVASILVVLAIPVLMTGIGVDDIFSYNATQWEKMEDPTLQDDSVYDILETLDPGTIYIENIAWLPLMIRNPGLNITELRYPLGQADVYPVPDIDYIAFASIYLDEPSSTIYTLDEWELIFEHETGKIYQRSP